MPPPLQRLILATHQKTRLGGHRARGARSLEEPDRTKPRMDRPIDCPTCRSSTGPCRLLEKNGCTLFRCSDCDHIFVHPVPGPEEIAQFYSFESDYMTGAEQLASAPIPCKFIDRIDRLCALRSDGRLLDVGCSYGQMLRAAREAGFDPVGLEMNPDTAAIARQLGFEVGS